MCARREKESEEPCGRNDPKGHRGGEKVAQCGRRKFNGQVESAAAFRNSS